jgi:MoaA/NifB/PqqE/SkfB family radical SAM enzyme
MNNKENTKFSAPTTANVELTEKCNARCLHCYNPCREESMGVNSHTIETLKKTIDELKKADVFHLIFTGGEPMSKIEVLLI